MIKFGMWAETKAQPLLYLRLVLRICEGGSGQKAQYSFTVSARTAASRLSNAEVDQSM